MQVQKRSRKTLLCSLGALLWMAVAVSGQNMTMNMTMAPATDAPSTSPPATDAPSTSAPVTDAPSTSAPETEAPSTSAPSSAAPVTNEPTSVAPATDVPSSMPSTSSPTTSAPVTEVPSFSPSTAAPSSAAPATPTPTTLSPTLTMAPSTSAPSGSPTSSAPATLAPAVANITMSPSDSSMAPTSMAPASMAPSTSQPGSMVPGSMVPGSMVPSGMDGSSAPSAAMNMTAPPTDIASNAPSTAPPVTGEPSGSPSYFPSSAPSYGPTSVPTPVGTSGPTGSPTTEETRDVIRGIIMTMEGISDMDDAAQVVYEMLIIDFSEEYVNNSGDTSSYSTNVEVKEVVGNLPTRGRVRRGLQTSVKVVYDQFFFYRTDDPNVNAESLAAAPFATEESREEFTQLLIDSGDPAFEDLEGVTEVDLPVEETDTPTASPSKGPTAEPTKEDDGGDDDDDGGLSTGAIVGIAVAGGVALILCLLALFFMSGGDDDQGGYDAPDEVKVTGGDEVSTLAPPANAGGAPASGDSLAGGAYGDQSVATVDYDYSKAYGGGGDTSVSSAGGTFGSNTQGVSQGDAAAAAGGALGGAGSFSDAESLRDPNTSVKEDLINIFAPPGKLGVVIDTPDDGAPVVHAVKDSSIIADKIKVGDKLVAVDDEDVRSMTAIKVSKLISRKSSNPTRKLTVIRTTVAE